MFDFCCNIIFRFKLGVIPKHYTNLFIRLLLVSKMGPYYPLKCGKLIYLDAGSLSMIEETILFTDVDTKIKNFNTM